MTEVPYQVVLQPRKRSDRPHAYCIYPAPTTMRTPADGRRRGSAPSAGCRPALLGSVLAQDAQIALARISHRHESRAIYWQRARRHAAAICRLHGVEFETLGHFCFDCNDRSRWRARELKTIYLPKVAEGMYLKLRLDVCHLNERNLYSQVGLVSIHAFGHGLGAELNLLADRLSDHDAIDAFMAASCPSAAIQAAKEIAFSDAAWRMQDPLSEQIAAGKVVSKGTAEAHRRAAGEAPGDRRGARGDARKRRLFWRWPNAKVRLEKEAAAREDDFERASQLKERENELAQVGAQLAELERKSRRGAAAALSACGRDQGGATRFADGPWNTASITSR